MIARNCLSYLGRSRIYRESKAISSQILLIKFHWWFYLLHNLLSYFLFPYYHNTVQKVLPRTQCLPSVYSCQKHRLYIGQCLSGRSTVQATHVILNFLVATLKKKKVKWNRCHKFYVTNYYIAYWIGKIRELLIWCWKIAFQSHLHLIVLIQIDFIEF